MVENELLTEDIEAPEQTTYEKGKELENQFSVFMKHELGWVEVRVGAHMAGKANVKGAAIDVIGARLDQRGKNFRKATIVAIGTALLMFVYGIIWALTGTGNGGVGFMTAGLMLIPVSLIYMYFMGKYNKEHAWVECKNLKGKVNINQIDKSIRELNDYRDSGNKEYKFECHYFVSANGYIENALKYAVDKGILCYQKEGSTFKRVGYWD
jgi:hypothetical protein